MKIQVRLLLLIIALLAAQLACNMPVTQTVGESQTQEPAPNLTLTALFAVTSVVSNATATPTLPLVVTATFVGSGANPTATQPASGSTNPTATTAAVSPLPTATFKPTAAQAAAAATVPGIRPRAQVSAKFLSTPPTIDGDWSEWKDTTTEYPATDVVWGRNNWSGGSDLAGSFHIGWDNTNLYIAVKIIDDTYVQNASGQYLYMGDSIEILMDTKLKDDFYYNDLSPDDFQLGITAGRPDINGTKEAYLWLPNNVAGARSVVKIAARQENGLYRVEAAIPWTVFEMTPTAGMHVGFGLSVSDNDNASQNLQQSMVSNNPDRSLVDPTTWGDLQLVK